ncbi:MAG TPA: hypothetical protein VEK73_05325 [Xanthobacteraceae bacterium]|nr:hypothetical protein [Xanthobacteraceae bacterium]
MAVTIDEMQVDVQRSAAPANAPAQPAAPKQATNFRAEKETLAERELRLKAD